MAISGGAGEAAAPASTGAAGFGTASTCGMVFSGANQIIGAIGGIVSAVSQGRIMDINYRIQKKTIETEGEIAGIEHDGMIEELEGTSEFNGKMSQMNERATAAKEERYKAEGALSEVDHEIKETKLTQKMAEPGNDKRLGMHFRNDSFYGTPESALG
jgi:hypothetical protein